MGALTPPGVGHRRHGGAAALLLLSWPALAAGRPHRGSMPRCRHARDARRLARDRALHGRDRRHREDSRAPRPPGQRLALVDGYVAEVPNEALAALAAADGVAGVHLDRPVGALLAPGPDNVARQRPAASPAARSSSPAPASASRSSTRGSRPGTTTSRASTPAARWSASASPALPTSRARPTRSPTATDTARTSPASSPDRVTTATASTRASRRVRICWC